MTKRFTISEVKHKLKDINHNIEIISDEYVNLKSVLICKCLIDKHEWESDWNTLRQGMGCPKCAGNIKRTILEAIEIFELHGLKICDEADYINSYTRIKLIDVDDYYVMASVSSVLSCKKPYRFSKSNPYTLENISNFILKNNLSNTISLKSGQLYYNNETDLIFICSKHGEFTKSWNLFQQNSTCPECSNSTRSVYDSNRLSIQRPDLIKYFENELDAMNVSVNSNKVIKLKCPYCNTPKSMIINSLSNRGFACPICSDGISIPEKFGINLLKQLDISFDTQYSPSWANKLKYDFYIPYLNIIIESHGLQHYKEATRGRSLKEEQENDLLKYNLAIDNGVLSSNYIIIDCRYSEFEWLKENYTTQLRRYFDLSNVDWNGIYENCMSSNIIQAISMWNNKCSVSYISDVLKLGKSTIRGYLNKGAEMGICIYDGKKNININRVREVIQYDLNENEVNRYESAMDAYRKTNISNSGISKCCVDNSFKYTAGGFKWKYSPLKSEVYCNDK